MSKILSVLLKAVCLSFLLFCAAGARGVAEGPGRPEPAAGPWLQREDEYFRYVYKKADSGYVERLMAVAAESYETVTGYMQTQPKEKPEIIIYGAQDEPEFGGFFAAFPMRIGLVAADAQSFSPRALLTHEFTHYMQASRADSGTFGDLIGIFAPDAGRMYSIGLADLSIEGTTSFIDGYRRSEWSTMQIRAAVLDGRMWDYNQVSTGGIKSPGGYRVYFSGMLVHDWLFDNLGDDAYLEILDKRDDEFLEFESSVFKEYTGLDFEVVWGDICTGLEEKYSFARELPSGVSRTPRDSVNQPQWGLLHPCSRGFLQYRSSLSEVPALGFWLPGGDMPGEAGILAADSGEFIKLEGLVSDDVSVDASGSLVAAVLNEPAKTSLFHDSNSNRIVIADVAWSSDGKKARARNLRYITGGGFDGPALTPKGDRLFARMRNSDFYRAVEIGPETGTITRLNIPEDVSVTEITVSPDGKKLALSYIRQGQYDVGVYDLTRNHFSSVTDDEAMDFYPRFMPDGAFLFSSDRENSIALYSFENGVFSRELADRIAAFAPAPDGRGGYFYSSYSADGLVTRQADSSMINREIVEDFAAHRPDWIAGRNLIWNTYREKGKLLKAKSSSESEVVSAAAPADEKPFIDIGLPKAWYPVIGAGLEGFSFGAGLAGYSYLGENSWTLDAEYIPDSSQITGSARLNFEFPFLSSTLAFSQDYYGTGLDGGGTIWKMFRDYSVSLNIPALLWHSPDNIEFSLDAAGFFEFTETIRNTSGFTFAESFNASPDYNMIFAGGMVGAVDWPSPDSALYGGSGIEASVLGLFEKNYDSTEIFPGILSRLGTSLLVSDFFFSLDAGTAWRSAGSAHEFFPATVTRWEGDSSAPFYGEIGLSVASSFVSSEYAFKMLSNELSGSRLGVKTFWEADSLDDIRWLEEFEAEYAMAWQVNVYYNPVFFEIGIGCRKSINELDSFELSDFCLKITSDLSNITF